MIYLFTIPPKNSKELMEINKFLGKYTNNKKVRSRMQLKVMEQESEINRLEYRIISMEGRIKLLREVEKSLEN